MADKKAEGQTHFMPALFDVKEFVSQNGRLGGQGIPCPTIASGAGTRWF